MNSRSKAIMAILLYPIIVIGVVSRILHKELKQDRKSLKEKSS